MSKLTIASLFHSLAAPNPGLYRCGDFLMWLELLTLKFLPKYSPLGDVTDWYSVPSGRKFSIEAIISWLLALEPLFLTWLKVAWFPSVPGYINDGLSVLLVTLSFKTIYSSEYCSPWTYLYSAPLNLSILVSLYLLKRVNCSSAVNQFSYNYGFLLV